MNIVSICNTLKTSQHHIHNTEAENRLYFLNCFIEFVVREPRWRIECFSRGSEMIGYRFILDVMPYKYYQIIVFRETDKLEILFKNGLHARWLEWKIDNIYVVDSQQIDADRFVDVFNEEITTMFGQHNL